MYEIYGVENPEMLNDGQEVFEELDEDGDGIYNLILIFSIYILHIEIVS